MQIIFNSETWVATLPPVKSPPPQKKPSMQAAGVSLQQFHTCPPPPLRGGRVSLLIALPLSDGAPVCQQSECGAERSVTHRQTVRVRDTEQLHGISGTAGVDERSDEVSTSPVKRREKRDLYSAPGQRWRSDLRSHPWLFYIYWVAADFSPEKGLLILSSKTLSTSLWVKSEPPHWNFNRAPSSFTRSTCVCFWGINNLSVINVWMRPGLW